MFLLSSKLVNISRTICIFNRAHLLSFPPFSSGPIFDAGSTCPWQFSRLPPSSPLHILIYRYIYIWKSREDWKNDFYATSLCHISLRVQSISDSELHIFRFPHIIPQERERWYVYGSHYFSEDMTPSQNLLKK